LEVSLMNNAMKGSRLKGKANKNSQWVEDLPGNTQLKSGVSATTGNLLLLMEWLNVNTPQEIEAIMNGLVKYWENSTIKQLRGQFHTAAEVWATYNYYLMNLRTMTQNPHLYQEEDECEDEYDM